MMLSHTDLESLLANWHRYQTWTPERWAKFLEVEEIDGADAAENQGENIVADAQRYFNLPHFEAIAALDSLYLETYYKRAPK